MKRHKGMRPQDIVILLKIVSLKSDDWKMSDLAYDLKISQSEISEGLHRCKTARLIDPSKKKVFKASLTEFLLYGLKYVFPVEPGAMVKGILTCHSAQPLSDLIASNEVYVWAFPKGNAKGQAIEPLYKTVPEIALKNKELYELLTLVDAIRIGRPREFNLASAELKNRLNE
jgi:predicted transcriptional regulator